MPSKKFLELQEFSEEELAGELKTLEQQYQEKRFDHSVKGLNNPLELREIRRDIARVKTEGRRRALASATAEQLANRSKIRERRRKS